MEIQTSNPATAYLSMMSKFSSDEDGVDLLTESLNYIVDGGIPEQPAEARLENQRIAIAALARVMKNTIEQYLEAQQRNATAVLARTKGRRNTGRP